MAGQADNTAAMNPILIISRPSPAGQTFADAVARACTVPYRVLHAPALHIVPLAFDMPAVQHVIFTSAHAVMRSAPGQGLTAWCVGGATAAAAAAKGYTVNSADGDADALVALILSQPPTGPMVHIAGRHRRGAVAARLTAAGLRCATVEAYDQVPQPLPEAVTAAAAGTDPLVAPVFSPRSAQGLLTLQGTAPLHVVAISPAVAALFKAMKPATLLTVGHPDADHMRDMTVALLCGLAGAEE